MALEDVCSICHIRTHKDIYNLQQRQHQRYCDFKGIYDSMSMLLASAKGIKTKKKKKGLVGGVSFFNLGCTGTILWNINKNTKFHIIL